MTAILGISAFYHDSAAALIIDGKIIAAAQEERFSRIKHDPSFPKLAIQSCLQQGGIEISELDSVVFYEKPFLKFERLLETYLHHAPRGWRTFTMSMPVWLKSKLYLSRMIRKGLDGKYRKRIIFPSHHESHAASAFFPSPFEEAAILTADGVGEWATTTWGVGKGNSIELKQEIRFPDSLGLLYSAFTAFCGFRVNGGEGKLMGLSSYGEPKYADVIRETLVDLKPDGSFRMAAEYFGYCTGQTMTSPKFAGLFGPARVPESEITQREMDLAASIQLVAEEILLSIAKHIHAETGLKNLCVAGGVGLNCVANSKLLNESPFENVWVQPAAGDSGGALGAALFAWHELFRRERSPGFELDAALGSRVEPQAASDFFTTAGAKFESFEQTKKLVFEVAKLLSQGNVVGWVSGRMEFGPRALGHRSILADPRDPKMQDRLNNKIKFREPFRPFAPIVRQERCRDFFEWNTDSPYMLFTANVRDDAQPALPAITHVDGTSRLQTVTAEQNPPLHSLLEEFENQTGSPVLVNTSFNVRGEPLVCDVEDAFACFIATGMDVLVVENCLLVKSNQPADLTAKKKQINKPRRKPWEFLLMIANTISFPLRYVCSLLVMSIVFFLLIWPMGMLIRWTNRSSFSKISRDADSYWEKAEEVEDESAYFKQF